MKKQSIYFDCFFLFKHIDMIQIFNAIITGQTKEYFLNLSIEEKVVWVKAHTAQKNEEEIYTFLANANYPEVRGCLSCGELNNKIIKHGDFSETNAYEGSAGKKSNLDKDASTGDSYERPAGTKKRKDKRI